MPKSAKFIIQIVSAITFPAIFGLLIRFERVQVQLRAQEENTIKILDAIKRANYLQFFFVLTLVFTGICGTLGYLGSELFGFS